MAIKKDIIITVENAVSKMSDSFYVYQGDKNIDIYFTIIDNRFEFSTIVPKQYSITIRKPDGDIIPTSKKTTIVDNKVQFTITAELVDELDEVGTYNLLIHLYDDLDSRISIPPVSFEVKQPLVTTNALANSGLVQNAILDEINNKLIRLDDNGKYVKTVWNKGDVITEENLNKIENQLEDLDKNRVDINSQLAEKANKTYVDALTQSLASGSPKGVFATVLDLTTAYPIGNTNIYVVTADGGWYYWNGSVWTSGGIYQSTGVEDSSITPTKTTFIKKSTNLFNKNNLIVGKALDTTTGLPVDNKTSGYTPQYEPITPNTKYVMSVNMTELTTIRAFHYDKDLNYISQAALTNVSGSPVIINGNPEYAYVRFSVRNTADVNSLQYNKGIEVLSYEPYYQALDDSIDLPGMTQENEIWEVL